MPTKKKPSFEDVKVELNYSQAIRDQMKFNEKYTTGDEWDEERIFHAAQFCKVFHNKTLNPYVIEKLLKEFEDDPYYEIWGTDYSSISDAKKAIDNGELPE